DVAEGANLLHHRRRLSKLGHRRSFSPGWGGSLWAAEDPPPRPGNVLDVLIDGEEVLPAVEQAIRAARSHVHISGWSITPGFALTRGDDPVIVRELLADVSRGVDVRVILWAQAAGRWQPSSMAERADRPRPQYTERQALREHGVGGRGSWGATN